MDAIPQELIERIISHLGRPDLKQTLTVSRKFSIASERASGAFSHFFLGESNVQRFIETYSSHRLRFLRHVQFTTTLPAKKWIFEQTPCRESAEDLRANDEVFTRQIVSLFQALKTVEEYGEREFGSPGRVKLTIHTPTRQITRNRLSCMHWSYSSWRVHLLDPECLPALSSIRSLHVQHPPYTIYNEVEISPCAYKLDLRVLIDLLVKLPHIEHLSCSIGGDEWSPPFTDRYATYFLRDYEGPRRDSRHGFAKAIQRADIPASLRSMDLDFLYSMEEAEDISHFQSMPDLVHPELYDPFSSSLRLLSTRLRRLQLRVMADQTLFWPEDPVQELQTWPHLEELEVAIHIVSPSGGWYFEGPNGQGRETRPMSITPACYPPLEDTEKDFDMDFVYGDEGDRRYRTSAANRFRIVPRNDTIGPVLASFAKAAATMMSLKEAILWWPVKWAPFIDDEEPIDIDDEGPIDTDDEEPFDIDDEEPFGIDDEEPFGIDVIVVGVPFDIDDEEPFDIDDKEPFDIDDEEPFGIDDEEPFGIDVIVVGVPFDIDDEEPFDIDDEEPFDIDDEEPFDTDDEEPIDTDDEEGVSAGPFIKGHQSDSVSLVPVKGMADNDRFAWGLVYRAPRFTRRWVQEKPEHLNSRRIWWRVSRWRPDPALHRLFQDIGRQKYGDALEEYWTHPKTGDDALADRYEFEDEARRKTYRGKAVLGYYGMNRCLGGRNLANVETG